METGTANTWIKASAQAETKRVHRVGSITFGITLILCGLIFLLHAFLPSVEILWVLQFWPVVLILLGIEVLAANAQEKVTFVYDKTAIVLTVLLIGFALAMAGVDLIWQHTTDGQWNVWL